MGMRVIFRTLNVRGPSGCRMGTWARVGSGRGFVKKDKREILVVER